MVSRRHSAVVLTIALAAALTLSAVVVRASASRQASLAVAAWNAPTDARRSVTWWGAPEAAPRSLHIESASVNAPSPDEFQISYGDGNFTLVYQRVAGGPVTSQYTLAVHGLVEWNDTRGDGHMEDGSTVAYTALGSDSFGRFPIQHSERTAAGGVGVNTFLIESNKGDVSLNLTIADGFVSLPTGQTLTPMEAKLSLEISHNMTLPGTKLSLQMGVSTGQKVAMQNESWDDLNEFSTDDRALNVTNDKGPNPSSAFFAWSNSASVNGQVGRVVATGPTVNETTGDYDLYLAYPRPSTDLHLQIVHDPTLGVVSAAYASLLHPAPESPLPFQGDPLIYAVSLAGIAVLVAGTALLVRHRNRKGL